MIYPFVLMYLTRQLPPRSRAVVVLCLLLANVIFSGFLLTSHRARGGTPLVEFERSVPSWTKSRRDERGNLLAFALSSRLGAQLLDSVCGSVCEHRIAQSCTCLNGRIAYATCVKPSRRHERPTALQIADPTSSRTAQTSIFGRSSRVVGRGRVLVQTFSSPRQSSGSRGIGKASSSRRCSQPEVTPRPGVSGRLRTRPIHF